MVIYRGSDGKPGYHQVDDIHDAVSFVEEMRNNDGVDHARIFRLEEVTFEYKPYYRVEIGTGAAGASAVAASDDAVEETQSSVVEIEESDDSDDSDEVSDDSSNGEVEAEEADVSDDDSASDESESESGAGARRGLFGR